MPGKTKLLASLTLTDATLLVIGAVIGSGIFLTSGLIAESLPSYWWILGIWLLGSLLSLFGGLTLAELGAMMPEAGGQYVYLREAYSPLAGFMYGWLTLLVTQTGGIAALAVGFAEYLAYFFPVLGLNQPLLPDSVLTLSYGHLVAAASIGFFTAVNYFGIRFGSLVQNIFTVTKLVSLGILIIAGIVVVSVSQPDTTEAAVVNMPRGLSLIAALGIALIAVLWTFDGWYAVNSVASEVKDATRNIPLSLIIGISVIGIIYLGVNLFYLEAMPLTAMAGELRIGEKATTVVFGEAAGSAMTGLILISILGCLSATIIYGPRIYYAMASDGIFFSSIAYVHPKYHTPTVAILWQGIWSVVLCLSGSYEQLFTYVVFTSLLFYIASTLAIFVLRRKQPHRERPYRVWGYPAIPLIFGFSMLIIAINALFEKPVESLSGILVIFVGLPVYFFWKKKNRESEY